MSASITRAWLDPRRHSVEGHTKQCILTFNGGIIWGPTHCHENTVELRDALRKADPRFDMIIMDKPHSVEGHTAWISVSRDDTVFLDKLHTHDNMSGLCTAIFNAQQVRTVALVLSTGDIVPKSSLRMKPLQHRHPSIPPQPSPPVHLCSVPDILTR